MNYEWDNKKNEGNIDKHGISFQYAKKVFEDEFRLESDLYYENGEYRYNVIGKVRKVLLVVCTDRSDDTIRIVSARKATKREEALYYDSYYDI